MEDSAGPQPPVDDQSNDRHQHTGLARYARTALIAGAAIAVVCLALLVIIFFLDSFNATVYSVGGQNIQDNTDEARQIRESYTAVRMGAVVFLVASAVTALAAAVVLYRNRNMTNDDDTDGGDDVDFEDLAGR
jgi:ABC-type Fe3+ transport system permease subunit